MQSMKDFSEISKLLYENGITIWADLGALLGLEREKKLLDWEEDIDVGTLVTRQEFRQVEPVLEEHGWKCFDKYKGLSIQNKDCTTKIDIKFYEETEEFVSAYFVVYKHRWVLSYCDFIVWFMKGYSADYKYETALSIDKLKLFEKVVKFVPDFLRDSIIKVTELVYYSYGLTGYKINFPRNYIVPLRVFRDDNYIFRIPCQSHNYLSLIYGENWNKPLKIIPGTDRYEDGSSRFLTKRVMEQRPELVEVAE